MTPSLSLFLDLVRILAAASVFLSHASWHDHTGGLMWQLAGIGREAVDVFFVLSGFVISHAAARATARDFAFARIARVASVAVPALALTWGLDSIGRAASPALYQGFCCEPATLPFLRNGLFLGDVWTHVAPGSNIPWWSLGYEVWYYAVFGAVFFAPRPWGAIAAAGLLLVAGPSIAVLFPLWLLGIAARRWCEAGGWGGPWALAAGLAGIVLATACGERAGEIYEPFSLTAARLGDYGQDYLIGLLFVLALAGARSTPLRLPARPIRFLAGATFTLYLTHLPMIRATVALSPWPASSWATRAMVLLGVPLVVLALAELTERRKSLWRAGLERLFPRLEVAE
jgi:peptidoglycan/LPS O-acetylase OafA/YrhL